MLLYFSCLALWIALSTPSSLAQSAAATPPQAEVTFYSSGGFMNYQIPGHKHGAFVGKIMDGGKELTILYAPRFVTFNLDPGEHTLTAGSLMAPGAGGGGHLQISLMPGQHYYVGAYAENDVAFDRFKIEQRTCQEAQDDNKSTKPLELKHVKKYGLARIVAESSFPTCPQNGPITPSSPTTP
jgi:hypothetical protein